MRTSSAICTRLFTVAATVAVATAGIAVASCSAAQQASATADPSTPVAVVDGQAITTKELEDALGTSLTKLEQDLYNLKRDRLEGMIGERLMRREAEKRGIEVQKLIELEITSKITPVTNEEVEAFYEANKARLPTEPDIKSQIGQYLANQRMQTRAQAFIGELRQAAKVDISLVAPPVRRAAVDIDGAPIRGNEKAPVTVVEFSDFHCPFCKRVQPTLLELLSRYPDKVRIVYMDMPIDSLHPQARRASEAARCARDQGKFWEYHDKIYAGGPDSSQDYLKKLASDVGLDVAAFEQCLASGKHKDGIQSHLQQASQLGLTGTPAFFVNGRPLQGAQPVEAFTQVIDEELRGADK
jgi:protein-disulfide isomerase